MLLSILALYNYDNTIFSTLPLPNGVDRETLINQIILDNAELSLVYASPTFMRWALENWGTTMLPIWNRFISAANAEYNPIENYDRYETSERDNTGSVQHSGTDTASGTDSATSTNSGTDTTTNKIAAFDTTTLPTHDEQTTTHGMGNTTTGTNSGSYVYGHREARSEAEDITSHIHGNIGVTTSQQMLTQELNIIDKLNIYQKISDDFRAKFCVEVW